MIECSLCSTSKSERYIFTECGHLVCMNCAALRATEILQCCGIKTVLDEEVKGVLRAKKQKILDNLSNEYEYERTDVNKVNYDLIQQRLRKIDELENVPIRKFQDQIQTELVEREQEMQMTPMDRFYKNPLILGECHSQIQQSTPIKLVSNAQEEDEIITRHQERNLIDPVFQQKPLKKQAQSVNRKPQSINKSQFIPVLQNNICSVRDEFKTIYDQLQKMQANIVYQMKIYFEEYVNLIENQTSRFDVLTEMERVNIFLDQFVQEWNIKEIKTLLTAKQNKSLNTTIKSQSKPAHSDIVQKRQLIYSNQIQPFVPNDIQPLSSCRLNYPSSHKKDNSIDDFIDKLRLSETLECENIYVPQASTSTGRNLDKIYRKLEESRSKLEERIQIHNEFMNKRCQKMGAY